MERLAQRCSRLNVTEPSLAGLNADVHAVIWSWLLPSHLPSALALMKTCSSLRVQLEPLRAKEVVHRLVWLQEMSRECEDHERGTFSRAYADAALVGLLRASAIDRSPHVVRARRSLGQLYHRRVQCGRPQCPWSVRRRRHA